MNDNNSPLATSSRSEEEMAEAFQNSIYADVTPRLSFKIPISYTFKRDGHHETHYLVLDYITLRAKLKHRVGYMARFSGLSKNAHQQKFLTMFLLRKLDIYRRSFQGMERNAVVGKTDRFFHNMSTLMREEIIKFVVAFKPPLWIEAKHDISHHADVCKKCDEMIENQFARWGFLSEKFVINDVVKYAKTLSLRVYATNFGLNPEDCPEETDLTQFVDRYLRPSGDSVLVMNTEE